MAFRAWQSRNKIHVRTAIDDGKKQNNDEDGTDLHDEKGAPFGATRVIHELKQSGGFDDPALKIIVTDGFGREVFRMASLKSHAKPKVDRVVRFGTIKATGASSGGVDSRYSHTKFGFRRC